MANNKNKLLIVTGVILVLALIGVTALLLSEKQTNRELVQEFQLEKKIWKTNTPHSPDSMTS